jgi:hypothetical protein
MARIQYNNESGFLGAPLNGTDTTSTITFGGSYAPNFATITGTDYIPLVLDAGTQFMEIVWLTAYTAGNFTGTITRGAEDTAHWPVVPHGHMPSATGNKWACAATTWDFPQVSYMGYRTTAMNLTSSAVTNIPIDTTWSYSGGIVELLGAIVFGTAGFYMVEATASIHESADGHSANGYRYFLSVYQTGVEVLRGVDTGQLADPLGLTCSGMVDIPVGGSADYLSLYAYNGYPTQVVPINVNSPQVNCTIRIAQIAPYN